LINRSLEEVLSFGGGSAPIRIWDEGLVREVHG
jgi:hypothetical protein